jgi:NAD(P)-dependent dehydrogenase (short-subunit alcohol dehydrogenase family)
VRGPFLLSRAIARGMVQRRSGVIIHVASQLGLVGMAGRPAYTASKGALINLTKTLALEWAPHGIRVNAVAYGPIRTPATERFIADPAASHTSGPLAGARDSRWACLVSGLGSLELRDRCNPRGRRRLYRPMIASSR